MGLFTVVFLIVVVGLLAITVGLISGQQQLTSVQTLEQTRALYAARARLEREIADALENDPADGCPGDAPDTNTGDVMGFNTTLLSSEDPQVEEGGKDYIVVTLEVRASRGNQRGGTLVQRNVQAQVTDANR